MKESFYITTPIYYVNDIPHIGHAYTTIAADTMARYKRMSGCDTFFLTGTDEHGQKIERAAKAHETSPIELADKVVIRFKNLWKRLDITNDDFIRTTEPRHLKFVQLLFNKLYEQGDIYLGNYEGWYCTPCESFFTETEAPDKCCPQCGRTLEKLKEESYFFRLSKYQDKLLEFYESHPDFVIPNTRFNEVKSFVTRGLQDLSVSRTSFSWGIPVPFDDKHVIYVWFDALINYISAINYGCKNSETSKYWPAVHIVGKDILQFHAVYWPAMLIAGGIAPPKQVVAHGWWTSEGKKMSKSLGNVVDPNSMISQFGRDSFRYFLLRDVPFGQDGDFSIKAIKNRINSDLANDLGNLFNRVATLIKKNSSGVIPDASGLPEAEENFEKMHKFTVESMEKFDFLNALKSIWNYISWTNKFITDAKPWALTDKNKLDDILASAAYALHAIAYELAPFMPDTAAAIKGRLSDHSEFKWNNFKWDIRGSKVEKGEILFRRYDFKKDVKENIDRKKEKSHISIDDVMKLELKTAEIVSAERVEKSEKLIKLEVSLKDEKRTIVAGIGKSYNPEELIGKKIVIVANLAPRQLFGIQSNGMLLAASNKDTLSLLSIDKDIDSGSPIH